MGRGAVIDLWMERQAGAGVEDSEDLKSSLDFIPPA